MSPRIILAMLLATSAIQQSMGQSCAVPQPLTSAQKAMVLGEWSGYYLIEGVKTEFKVTVDKSGETISYQVSPAPLQLQAGYSRFRFCGAGAFHFGKEYKGQLYEFDGVPENDVMKGALKVASGSGKDRYGEFYLKRKPS